MLCCHACRRFDKLPRPLDPSRLHNRSVSVSHGRGCLANCRRTWLHTTVCIIGTAACHAQAASSNSAASAQAHQPGYRSGLQHSEQYMQKQLALQLMCEWTIWDLDCSSSANDPFGTKTRRWNCLAASSVPGRSLASKAAFSNSKAVQRSSSMLPLSVLRLIVDTEVGPLGMPRE